MVFNRAEYLEGPVHGTINKEALSTLSSVKSPAPNPMSLSGKIVACLIFVIWVSISGSAQTPELVVQTGHVREIHAVACSSDGKLIATSGSDETVIVWDISTGKQLYRLAAHGFGLIMGLVFSPDNKLLASAGDDRKIKFWNVTTGVEVGRLEGHTHYVRSLAFSPDGRILASGSFDKKIRLWDVATRQTIRILDDTKYVYALTFSPDGKTLASGGEGRDIKLWDIGSGVVLRTFLDDRSPDRTSSLAFSRNGKTLASGHGDRSLGLWSVETGNRSKDLGSPTNGVSSVAFSPNGKFFASAGKDGNIVVWDSTASHELRRFQAHTNGVDSISFSGDDSILASVGGDREIKLWDLDHGVELRSFARHASSVICVALSPDSRFLAQGSDDHTIKLWDLSTGKLVRVLKGHPARVVSVSFSPDGKFLASGTVFTESAGDNVPIKLWEVATGMEIRSFVGHSISVNSLAFTANGNILASASNDKTAKLWDVNSGREIATLSGFSNPVYSVSFSPNGKLLATGSFDKTIKLWDVTTAKVVQTLPGHDDSVRAVAFSPSGRVLASAGNDRLVRLWDLSTGQQIISMPGHTNNILAVSFGQDGKTLASAGLDKMIKVWSTDTGKELATLLGHSDTIYSLVYSSDQKVLVSGSNDAVVKIWNAAKNLLMMNLVAVDEKDYLIDTPDNFYLASRGAFVGVAFRSSNRVYPFEQFDLRRNRPDLVLGQLGYSSPELVDSYRRVFEKRLQIMNFKAEMLGDDYHLPEVAPIAPQTAATTNKNLSFSVTATDPQYLLDRINVYINDVPIFGSAGISLRSKGLNHVEQKIDLELSPGNNKVQVSALNEKGAESLKQTFNLNYTAPPGLPTLYIVAVGVSQYADAVYKLNSADKDATDLISFFRSKKERFADVKVLPILNTDATRENILKARDFLMASKVDDEVVLFLAGHGMLDEKLDYYFGTSDIDFSNPAKRGLSYEAIEGLLDGIPARKKLLLMDTCHAGEVDKQETRMVKGPATTTTEPGSAVKTAGISAQKFPRASVAGGKAISLSDTFELLQELFTELRRGSGATVISAASGVKYAYEGDGNGIFTQAVLEGLRGKADTNRDGVVKVSELRDYVMKVVQQLTEGNQKPTSRRENLENDFALF